MHTQVRISQAPNSAGGLSFYEASSPKTRAMRASASRATTFLAIATSQYFRLA